MYLNYTIIYFNICYIQICDMVAFKTNNKTFGVIKMYEKFLGVFLAYSNQLSQNLLRVGANNAMLVF